MAALIAVAMLAVGVAHAAGPTSATVSAPAERLGIAHDSVRALIISDSTWLSLRNYGSFDAIQGFTNEMALAHCRRRVEPSCLAGGIEPPPTLLEELNNRGGQKGWNTLVVQTGYNDSDANFTRDFRAIVASARQLGYSQIIWVTLRPPDTDPVLALAYNTSNALLLNLVQSGKYPEVVIADWASYSVKNTDWFRPDQIHYTELGSWAAADYISRKIAYLNEWACPQPMKPGVKPLAPCPDPDKMAAKPALTQVYPVTKPYDDPTNSWSGSSSWPEPPWWES